MRRRVFALAVFVALPVVGCSSPDPTPTSTTVTDDLGRRVALDEDIQRVVSLAPNLTELVYAAGAGSTLVAATTADDYPPAVDTLDRLSALPLDFEALTAKRPDLVLATDQVNPPGDTDTFDTLDLPVYFFSFSSLDDVLDALSTIGRLLDTKAAAQDTLQDLQRRIKSLTARTNPVPREERPRVLVLIGDDTLYSFGAGSYVHTLVEMAGGRSVTDTLDATAPTLTDEYVLTAKPDVIVGAWGADYDPDRLLKLHPTWDVVPALRNDRVYSLPPALLLRPGPRLVDGAWALAAQLHPDRFDGRAGKALSSDSTANVSVP